jgi:sterol desaturase/sphingolipid hydroxylase (fatty acid hydroxylase superfamily)
MMARVTLLAAVVACAFVAAELAVYATHRWISHGGLLRRIRNDLLRRAHYHHHFEQYPPHALHARTYIASHDVTFVIVEAFLFLGAVTTSHLVKLDIFTVVAMAIGVVGHGTAAATVHAICHATDAGVRQCLPSVPLRAMKRLRQFHDLHHIGRGNYSLLIPIVDRLAGTRVRNVVQPASLQHELFPGLSERSPNR